MTISATYSPDTYAGDGATDTFAVTFSFLSVSTNVKVSIKVDSTGVITTKTAATHYNVSGSNVVFTAGNIPASGETIIIELNPDFKQTSDYAENAALPAETLETDLDERCLEGQINKDNVARSLKLDASVTGVDGTIVASSTNATNADKYVKFDSAGTGFEVADIASLGAVAIPVPVASGGTGSTTAAAARTALGVDGHIESVVEDTTPQLGGDLDANGSDIQFDDATGIRDDSDNEQLIFQKTASAINHIEITNAAAGGEPRVGAVGDDTNVSLELATQGTGTVNIVGNSTQAGALRIYEDTDQGSAYVGLTTASNTDTPSVTYTLPNGDGSNGDVLSTDGSGVMSWTTPAAGVAIVSKTTTYTATTSDDVITVDTSGGDWTLTLYAASGNAGKRLTIIKTSSDWNELTVDGNASETINGNTTTKVHTQYEKLKIVCDGTNWLIEDRQAETAWASYTPTTQGWGSISTPVFIWRRVGDCIEIQARWTNGTVTASEAQVHFPDSSITVSTLLTSPLPVGYMVSANGSSDNNNMVIATSGDAFVNFVRGAFSASAANGNTWNSSEGEGFTASVPVDGWKGANE